MYSALEIGCCCCLVHCICLALGKVSCIINIPCIYGICMYAWCILSIAISVWMTTEQTIKCKSIKDRPHQTHFICLLHFYPHIAHFGLDSGFSCLHLYDYFLFLSFYRPWVVTNWNLQCKRHLKGLFSFILILIFMN